MNGMDYTLVAKQENEESSRIGRFVVSRKFVIDSPKTVAMILSKLKCVPIRVELLFTADAFEYVAYSSLFEKVKCGETFPTYTIDVKTKRSRKGYDIMSISVKKGGN